MLRCLPDPNQASDKGNAPIRMISEDTVHSRIEEEYPKELLHRPGICRKRIGPDRVRMDLETVLVCEAHKIADLMLVEDFR